jgi:hypothetical protein
MNSSRIKEHILGSSAANYMKARFSLLSSGAPARRPVVEMIEG